MILTLLKALFAQLHRLCERYRGYVRCEHTSSQTVRGLSHASSECDHLTYQVKRCHQAVLLRIIGRSHTKTVHKHGVSAEQMAYSNSELSATKMAALDASKYSASRLDEDKPSMAPLTLLHNRHQCESSLYLSTDSTTWQTVSKLPLRFQGRTRYIFSDGVATTCSTIPTEAI